MTKFTLEQVKKNGYYIRLASKEELNDYDLQYASAELRNDKKFVLEAVSRDGEALRFASLELRNDREVVLEAVSQIGGALFWASEELQNDEKFVLEAIKKNGLALQYASEELRGNREVVLEAMKQNPDIKRCAFILFYATDELQNDKTINQFIKNLK
jgi:hypothetical protein